MFLLDKEVVMSHSEEERDVSEQLDSLVDRFLGADDFSKEAVMHLVVRAFQKGHLHCRNQQASLSADTDLVIRRVRAMGEEG